MVSFYHLSTVFSVIKLKYYRADKDGDGEISKSDWFDALTAAKFEVTM